MCTSPCATCPCFRQPPPPDQADAPDGAVGAVEPTWAHIDGACVLGWLAAAGSMLVAFIAARMQDASYAEAAIPALIVGCAAFALLAGHLLRRWSAPRPMRSVGLAIGAFGTALLVGVAVVEGGLAIARQTIPTESNEAGLMLFGLFGLPALAVAAFCGGLVTPSVVYRIAWRVWRRGEPRARASSPTR